MPRGGGCGSGDTSLPFRGLQERPRVASAAGDAAEMGPGRSGSGAVPNMAACGVHGRRGCRGGGAGTRGTGVSRSHLAEVGAG